MTQQENSILTINALSSGFESDSSNFLALSLDAGQHLVISGPSGCGKSSLLQILAGLRPSQSGQFQWQQQIISEHNLGWWRQQFCYLPQQPVMGGETIGDALLLPWQMKAVSSPQPESSQCEAVLTSLHLKHPLSHPVKQLSGGEKQRLAIGRALLMNRPLWLLDEPTSALDPHSRDRVMALLKEQGLTMVSVSHDPVWVEAADCQHDMGGE
ncbi:ABC transporter [Photobacterium sanctipauli]|uniref:ABC transporter n=1 Tax=Photobacterium sanctipauli TaxID=1342794 RepID=A0A2T3NX03_9GAMM|nr:ATP-binding cassette domain-containing protein [Photobacterium sanctipauli]PSW20827.1 ABC transporter [Photobacterium sanctipauli]